MAMVKCKECGETISSKASACPNCGAPIKKKRSGCGIAIIAVFVLFLIGVLVPDNEPAASPSPNSAKVKSEYTAADNAVYEGAIQTWKSGGLIISIDTQAHTVVVEPSVWKALGYEYKRKMASVVGAHLNYKTGYSSVTIRDKYTNKKIGAFGPLGFKVYD